MFSSRKPRTAERRALSTASSAGSSGSAAFGRRRKTRRSGLQTARTPAPTRASKSARKSGPATLRTPFRPTRDGDGADRRQVLQDTTRHAVHAHSQLPEAVLRALHGHDGGVLARVQSGLAIVAVSNELFVWAAGRELDECLTHPVTAQLVDAHVLVPVEGRVAALSVSGDLRVYTSGSVAQLRVRLQPRELCTAFCPLAPDTLAVGTSSGRLIIVQVDSGQLQQTASVAPTAASSIRTAASALASTAMSFFQSVSGPSEGGIDGGVAATAIADVIPLPNNRVLAVCGSSLRVHDALNGLRLELETELMDAVTAAQQLSGFVDVEATRVRFLSARQLGGAELVLLVEAIPPPRQRQRSVFFVMHLNRSSLSVLDALLLDSMTSRGPRAPQLHVCGANVAVVSSSCMVMAAYTRRPGDVLVSSFDVRGQPILGAGTSGQDPFFYVLTERYGLITATVKSALRHVFHGVGHELDEAGDQERVEEDKHDDDDDDDELRPMEHKAQDVMFGEALQPEPMPYAVEDSMEELLRTAFVLHCSEREMQSISKTNELFARFPIVEIGSTAVELCRKLMDTHPFAGRDATAPGVATDEDASSAAKASSFVKFARFLRSVSLKQHKGRTVWDVLPTASRFAVLELGELLRATQAVQSLVRSREQLRPQFVGLRNALLRRCTQRCTESWGEMSLYHEGLSFSDIYFAKVSRAHDLLATLDALVEGEYRQNLDAAQVVSSVMEAMYTAAAQFRVDSAAWASPEPNAAAVEPWTFAEDNVVLVRRHLDRLESCSHSQHASPLQRQQLYQSVVRLGHFLMDEYAGAGDADSEAFVRDRRRVMDQLQSMFPAAPGDSVEKRIEVAFDFGKQYRCFAGLVDLVEELPERERAMEIVRLMAQYGEAFAVVMFARYLELGRSRRFLTMEGPNDYHTWLSRFLQAHPHLSWIHDVTFERYDASGTTLERLALAEPRLLRRRNLLSAAKLSLLSHVTMVRRLNAWLRAVAGQVHLRGGVVSSEELALSPLELVTELLFGEVRQQQAFMGEEQLYWQPPQHAPQAAHWRFITAFDVYSALIASDPHAVQALPAEDVWRAIVQFDAATWAEFAERLERTVDDSWSAGADQTALHAVARFCARTALDTTAARADLSRAVAGLDARSRRIVMQVWAAAI